MPITSTFGAMAARGFGLFSAIKQAVDEYFEYVTMLLPGNGTNGAQNNTFLDSSTNNFTITRNGNTTQGTFTPYGENWSNYFDGTGDYLTVPSNAALAVGSTFTVECWVYRTVGSTIQWLAGNNAGSGNTNWLLEIEANNTVYGGGWGSGTQTVSTVPVAAWTHIAMVCDSGSLKIYIDGIQSGTAGSGANFTASDITYIGQYSGVSRNLTGYISNLRVLKGTALYTANFTPPTAPLTAITNTSLLTCQSNRFIDNSANAFAITRNGDTSVQRFSPFSPTAAYSTSVVGGSGYFDGTGDYLSAADNAALELGSSNFCIENWFYQQANPSRSIVNKRANSGSYGLSIFAQNASNSVVAYISSNGSSWDIVNGTSLGTIIPSAWNHVALYRSGNSWYGAMNGTVTLLTTNSSAVVNNSAAWNFGAESDGFGVTGYLADGRIVIGSAVYGASNFTPPTAPLTAITNTSLLLNYTNAGVIDNAMMNNLETVGNAQISTTQSKWGGSSIAFDGTGDGLYSPYSDLLTFRTGNFTVEFWMYFNSKTGYQTIASLGYTTNATNRWIIQTGNGDGKLLWYYSSVVATDTGSTVNTGQWYHIAIVKNVSTVTIYRDGVSVGSGTDNNDYNPASNSQFYIGGGSSTGFNDYYFNGYIDDLRITKGFARYTANFTVPAGAFPTR